MIAGVDGCRTGWLVALGERWPCLGLPELRVCPDFAAVLRATESCDIVVVDMPIGLMAEAAGRECDRLAKQLLGPRAASRVFWPPPRGALVATTPREFQRLHRDLTGTGAGIPVWGIVPKLLDVDRSLTPRLQERVREFHPELVWRRLAGRVLWSKHSAQGLAEREEILAKYVREITAQASCFADRRKGVRRDDVLDAVVGLAAAQSIVDGREPPHRLPAQDVPVDGVGRRMEIWY